MARSKLVKRFKRRKARTSAGSGPRRNPPLFTDLIEFIGPGFGGFAATRFLTRITATAVAKKWPKVGRHAGALASIGTFFAAWLVAHKIKWLAKYHTPIVVGAGIATGQSLIQLYVPKLGWIVSDASPELASGSQQQQVAAQSAQHDVIQDEFEVLDDNHWYTYNDAQDPGRYATTPKSAQAAQQRAGQTPQDTTASDDDAALDFLEEEEGDLQAAGFAW